MNIQTEKGFASRFLDFCKSAGVEWHSLNEEDGQENGMRIVSSDGNLSVFIVLKELEEGRTDSVLGLATRGFIIGLEANFVVGSMEVVDLGTERRALVVGLNGGDNRLVLTKGSTWIEGQSASWQD